MILYFWLAWLVPGSLLSPSHKTLVCFVSFYPLRFSYQWSFSFTALKVETILQSKEVASESKDHTVVNDGVAQISPRVLLIAGKASLIWMAELVNFQKRSMIELIRSFLMGQFSLENADLVKPKLSRKMCQFQQNCPQERLLRCTMEFLEITPWGG